MIPRMNIANTAPDEAVRNKAETAEFLKVKVRTIDDWIRRKRIPFAKLPSGTVRFRKSQLLDFIAKYEWAMRGGALTRRTSDAGMERPRLPGTLARAPCSGGEAGGLTVPTPPFQIDPLCGYRYQEAGEADENGEL